MVFITNAIVFGFGLTNYSETHNPGYAPPSWVIATVWFILFVLNGAARWSLNSVQGDKAKNLKRWLVAILVVNITHPIYTAGFSIYETAFVGTVIGLAMTLYVIVEAWPVKRAASYLMMPLAFWYVFAGSIILTVLGWVRFG